MIGRQKEVLRISQILGRKKKNNPILLGEPGECTARRRPAQLACTACEAESALHPGLHRRPVAIFPGLPSFQGWRMCVTPPPPPAPHPTSPPAPPLLPGVGKTAIAEGLARAIVTRCQPDGSQLPDFLEGKRVIQLDVGLLIAGAKVSRGLDGLGGGGGGGGGVRWGWQGAGRRRSWGLQNQLAGLPPSLHALLACQHFADPSLTGCPTLNPRRAGAWRA